MNSNILRIMSSAARDSAHVKALNSDDIHVELTSESIDKLPLDDLRILIAKTRGCRWDDFNIWLEPPYRSMYARFAHDPLRDTLLEVLPDYIHDLNATWGLVMEMQRYGLSLRCDYPVRWWCSVVNIMHADPTMSQGYPTFNEAVCRSYLKFANAEQYT